MINVAIDGPAGAGKSTVAKAAAKKLGFIYVDTGALYRTVGVNALRKGIDPKDAEEVKATLDDIDVSLGFVDGSQHVFLNGEDVSEEIRLPASSMAASAVSAIPEVREFLLSLQRDIAKKNNCLMDGRDIGTVILPDAQYKFFFTASAEIRADRRCKELKEKGIPADYETVLAEIKERDYNDSHRETAPLKQADDAVLIDSSYMTIEEAVDKIVSYIKG
ncbi:MAG: (d)CMP kinase [Oscillospiraceae bacterium]|nr:(d)CMP kinase [Oscillospiraceae bacterium]MDD7353590.1 (d)CMP kinase [Oscillospiraceae bacterium]MDY3937549.1 (d)CMP kinase [Oscillospiraceae bacterium]